MTSAADPVPPADDTAHAVVTGPTPLRILALWGPVLAWMAAIFAASSTSSGGSSLDLPDWLTHGTAYLVLSVLACRALAGGSRKRLLGRHALAAVVVCGAYGVGDEVHQSFVPGRDPSAADVGKDVAGALVGALGYRRASRAVVR